MYMHTQLNWDGVETRRKMPPGLKRIHPVQPTTEKGLSQHSLNESVSVSWGDRWWRHFCSCNLNILCPFPWQLLSRKTQRNFQWPSFLLLQHTFRYNCRQLRTITESHAFRRLKEAQNGSQKIWWGNSRIESGSRPPVSQHHPWDVQSHKG